MVGYWKSVPSVPLIIRGFVHHSRVVMRNEKYDIYDNITLSEYQDFYKKWSDNK